MHRLGIDLGGTKIEGLVLDQQGQELGRLRVPTPRTQYNEVLTTLKDLVAQCEQRFGACEQIGIGIPGSVSPATGKIRNANLLTLNGQRFHEDLQKTLQRSVALANDADCLALSEFRDGAGAEAKQHIFAVIIGTGCGGGLVVNGQLVQGCNGIAGEWGHNPLPHYHADKDGLPGPCYCGLTRCQEQFLSGTGFAQGFQRRYGGQWRAEQIVAAAEQGDAHASDHVALYCDQLARGLAAVINLVDPEMIILGGGMSNVKALYQQVPTLLEKYVFSDVVYTTIRQAKHGDSSGVRGAAWLIP